MQTNFCDEPDDLLPGPVSNRIPVVVSGNPRADLDDRRRDIGRLWKAGLAPFSSVDGEDIIDGTGHGCAFLDRNRPA
jgi:hypothetical protein